MIYFIFISLAIFLIVPIFLSFVKNSSVANVEKELNDDERGKYVTKDLFVESLERMNCEYEMENEANFVKFEYQGLSFFACFEEGCVFPYLYLPYIYMINRGDDGMKERARILINKFNSGVFSKFYYSSFVDEDTGDELFSVSMMTTFLFKDEISNLNNYLQAIFSKMIENYQYFYKEMNSNTPVYDT